ncbi:MAG: hypothetical protein VZT48_12260 [Bulleidia sp.]|nr:hypothetical protein [Bulleidia sp.]
MAEFVRRNEDRDQDSLDDVKREEILAEDRARMATGTGSIVGKIIAAAIWILAAYVLMKLLFA